MGSCFRKHSSSSINDDNASLEEPQSAGPVMVELFSSLGCASSPEAELLLSRVGRGDFNLEMPVILLAYHVDYWNHMGWKDPFGSSLWTVRQKAYIEALQLDATMYTPQAIFQGRAQCMGNLEDALLSCIKSAPRYPGLAFQVCRSIHKSLFILKFWTGNLMLTQCHIVICDLFCCMSIKIMR